LIKYFLCRLVGQASKKMTAHRVEFKFEIISSCPLVDDGGSWLLENVSGKLIANGDDVLSYRLVYSLPQGKNLGNASLIIKLWPELPEHGRRQGRPEVGFLVTPPSRVALCKAAAYYPEATHSVVVTAPSTEDAQQSVKAIYFGLEDCNFEASGPPLWRISINESLLLGSVTELKGRWIPLPPVHPDPALVPADTPICAIPQRSPPWYKYRDTCKYPHIFKRGKISGSSIFDFIAGRYFDDDDRKVGGTNNVMRFGRASEPTVVMAHLLACNYVARETGTYPHPSIEDACSTADAELFDKGRTFGKLPVWVQKQWMAVSAKLRDAADFERGILEAKTMLKLDYKRLGPVIKAEHIAQMYWTMLCTETYWGEYIRGCDETKECRIFHIHMILELGRELEACVKRMREDMIAGIPYAEVCDTEQNRKLVAAFHKQATHFNYIKSDQTGIQVRFHKVAWPTHEAAVLERMAAAYDVCRVDRLAPDAAAEPAKKRQRKKAATPKAVPPKAQHVQAPAAAPAAQEVIRLTPATILPMVQAQQQLAYGALVADLDSTHKVLVKCLLNKDYDEALQARVFHAQICRLMEIHGLCLSMQAEREMRSMERDE
jgi:hypothetical protein